MTPEQIAEIERKYRKGTAAAARKDFEELVGGKASEEGPAGIVALAVLFAGRMLVDAMSELQLH